MLESLRIVLAIIVLVLAGYGLLTGNSEAVSPYMMFFMGAMLLVMGISEIRKERKRIGFISIIVSLFVFYVSIQGFLLNFTS
ncbi:YczI family protein [Virgibacillus sp. C22-A2]|uniref:YczI family protein n=1 Tax=Virgibacillus tibetensis TaxID=3042313 RepID=A0ABU6KKP4_9BACI|nr:YczI family protein [Virgibacillus sp. C22-A2]